MTTRRSARIASKRSQDAISPATAAGALLLSPDLRPETDRRRPDMSDSNSDSDTEQTTRPSKRRKTSKRNITAQQTYQTLFSNPPPPSPTLLPSFPSRAHSLAYHSPLLLSSPEARTALLAWFTKASTLRPMPWRKPWLDPATFATTNPNPNNNPNNNSSDTNEASRPPPGPALRAALAQRAYEVWVSEVMLQQTRVPVVVGYWTRWMARWPTLRDLARAREEDVLAAWQGLGYYARARRLWRAARVVCGLDQEEGKGEEEGEGKREGEGEGEGKSGLLLDGMLPGSEGELMRTLPGVGRYTAGAIAAIVFGVPAAMVDGNVLRVLSRQMGLLADVKGDKRAVDLLWEAAEALVRAVARDGQPAAEGDELPPSDRPGRWGQALMELGSTICTPTPKCSLCPITRTCRAYAEGLSLAAKRGIAGDTDDIEDICSLCAPFDETAEGDEEDISGKGSRDVLKSSNGTLSRFFAATPTEPSPPKASDTPDAQAMETIIHHAKKFPLRKPKKKVREEETLVCAVRRSSNGQFLICRRPEKGLLAGLWELPSHTLPDPNDSTAKSRTKKAKAVPWLFSHLKLAMHVHLFELDDSMGAAEFEDSQRWATVEEIDRESMGTGMKKCWSLVKASLQ
ncbi:df5cb24c-15cf-4546-a267-3de3e6443d7d [Thermothielavioides terrestris]|uniref:Adenine DNA glycosylase n=1 Tax=Thermothielavioides terrestris TaxID=2587410 RepID=A0A3S4ATH1_9PEZI|nr:df5cb24c-15cf-4546-a267-3de3e6443d7d [Thermothielavioides terrestris]